MDYLRRSVFRQQGQSLDDVDTDVEWQPQQLNQQHPSQPTRRPFSSLFARNNDNTNTTSNNKYAVASNFGESTENLASPKPRFSLGIPSMQLPSMGLVGHTRFSGQSSAPRPLFTQRTGATGRAGVPSSVYPPTEYHPSDNLASPVPAMPTQPMPIYTGAARSRRGQDRHGRTRKTSRKHSHAHSSTNKSRSDSGSKHGRSRRHQQQSSRHRDVNSSAVNGGTESSLSSSTDSSGFTDEKNGRSREHRRRARSPPRPFMGCFPPVRSRRMRTRIVQCAVAGLFLVLISGIFAILALTNTVDPTQLTIPMAVIVGVSALILAYCITRLVMFISHKRNKSKARAQRRDDLEAQKEKQQQQQHSTYTLGGNYTITEEAVVPGLDAGISRVEPPAYGHWRESMRVDPSRAQWQHTQHSPISEKSQYSPQAADYANHPAVAGTSSSSAPFVTAHQQETRSYPINHSDNEVAGHDNTAVSDLGSSALSSFSPNASAVSSPSVAHYQDEGPGTVPTTPWPRPPSYISNNGNTSRARHNNNNNNNNNNNYNNNYNNTAAAAAATPNSFLAPPPNPPPTLMQLPSDFSLFQTSSSSRLETQRHDNGADDIITVEEQDTTILPQTRFQPAYYVPNPRDTQAYQAQQRQEYAIDRAASEAAMSRAQSPVNYSYPPQHQQRHYGGGGSMLGSALGMGARSDCGTIEVGITQSQYLGGGGGGAGGYGYGLGGVAQRNDDEIVYDDYHHQQQHNGADEVAYIDVEVYSSDEDADEVVHDGVPVVGSEVGSESSSKRKSRTNRDRRRKERRGNKADGTPLIGQLGGAHGWS